MPEILNQYGNIYSDPPERIRHSGRGLVVRDGKVLLSYERNTGVYMSPGGGWEDGETLAECCVRELKEETGCIVETIGDEFVMINEYSFETLYIGHYFLCKVVSEGEYHLTPTEIDHGMQPVWIDLDEAVAIFETYPQKREDHRSLYLRELTVLRKYLAAQTGGGDA